MANIHSENFDKTKIELIGFISFLLGFGQAVLIYIASSYFAAIAGTENIGVFYLAAYVIELVLLLNFHKAVSYLGRSRMLIFLLLIKVLALLALVAVSVSPFGIFPLIVYIIVGSLSWVALDMILESCSTDRFSGRIRGLHLTVMNAGFIFGPFISTYLLGRFNFEGVFVFMAILYIFIFLFSLISLRGFNGKLACRPTIMNLLRAVRKRKNVLRAYYISCVLEFFYALMVIYTPLYLRGLGLEWSEIGIIFTAMLAPFVILQYPAGLLADKKTGEKELLIISLAVMGASTLAVYFVSSTAVAVWAVVLFITRIGASLIEVLRDSYFYKRIGSGDIDLIDFFRTARATAYITAAPLSTILLLIFPLKAIFLLIAAVVFSALYPALRLADSLPADRTSLPAGRRSLLKDPDLLK